VGAFDLKNRTFLFVLPAILLSILSAALSGCAHTPRAGGPRTVEDILRQDPKKQVESVVYDNGEIVIQGIKLKNTSFDIPISVNSRVEFWVDYFTGKGRPHFAKYLERSEFFVPYIRPLLKQNKMPEDLVYLAMIESGFNNHARSHAKAVGPWQFISATGKRYGLSVNWWLDERRDIRKSTLAAAEYLKDLYGIFQSWELAASAYNAGESKVARAVRRFGTKDFWAISRHRFLRPETRDYVPKIIAAALISKNAEQFGFPKSSVHAGADEAIAGDGELVKLVKTDKPEETLPQDWDSDFEDGPDEDIEEAAQKPTGREVTPVSLLVQNDPAPSGDQPLAKSVPTPHVTKSGEVGGEELAEFEVQSPADLLKIARAAGLSYQTVKALNPELLRWCTPPNLGSYRLKLPESVKETFLSTYNHSEFPRKVDFLTYKVRSGETLHRIARHFGIRVDPISDLNGVSPKMPLRSGVRVLLPMPQDRSRSLASLEVRDPPEKRRIRRYRKVKYKYRVPASKRRESAYRATIVDKNS